MGSAYVVHTICYQCSVPHVKFTTSVNFSVGHLIGVLLPFRRIIRHHKSSTFGRPSNQTRMMEAITSVPPLPRAPPCALLVEMLAVGDICSALGRFLRFEDLKALSSLNSRLVAVSLARVQLFTRSAFRVPTFMSDGDLELFLSRIRPNMIPLIKTLRVESSFRFESRLTIGGADAGSRTSGWRQMLSMKTTRAQRVWGFFPRVEVLDLADDLSATLDSVGQLTKLQSLDMSANISLNLAPLAECHSLKHLFLNESNVSNESLAHIKNLTLLETLEIRNCRFVSDVSCLAGLTNLRRLVIGGNAIKDFSVLSQLTNLCHFQHASASRKSWPKMDFPLRAPELEHCDVAGTPVRDVDFLLFSPRLAHLNISWTTLAAAPPLAHLKQLKVLIVSSPLPRDLECYAPLETLRELERIEFHKIGNASLEPPVVEAKFPACVRHLLVFP